MTERFRKLSPTWPLAPVAPQPKSEDAATAGDKTPDKAEPFRPDCIAARLILAASIPSEVSIALASAKPVVVVIKVPAPNWCGILGLAAYSEMTVEDDDDLDVSSIGRTAWITADGSQRDHRPEKGNETVVAKLGDGRSLVGVSTDPERFLPSALVEAADFVINIQPMTGALVAKVIKTVTGHRCRGIDDKKATLLDPSDLVLAVRPGSSAADCASRIERICRMRDRSVGGDVADLSSMSAEVREWAAALARDLAGYRQGMPWELVSTTSLLLISRPGLGKTMAARSIASSLGIPLISSGYHDWQASGTGHLGDTLRALQKCHAECVRRAPIIWLCDEIDSLPSGLDSDHQTYFAAVRAAALTAFERAARPWVYLIGASNTEVLDPALVRPGRFGDRIVRIPDADEEAIRGILRHHLGNDLPRLNLSRFARAAAGATGADIALLVRAARSIAQQAGRPLAPGDLMQVISPAETRSRADTQRAAMHEAAHAVASLKLSGEVGTVTIIARGRSGGRTESARMMTSFPTLDYLENRAVVLFAGRAAEQLLLGAASASCGGSQDSDLGYATSLVESLHVSYGFGASPTFRAPLGRTTSVVSADPELRRTVDQHVARLYEAAISFVTEHAVAIAAVAERLLETRVLAGDEVRAIVARAEGHGVTASRSRIRRKNSPIIIDTPIASAALKKKHRS